MLTEHPVFALLQQFDATKSKLRRSGAATGEKQMSTAEHPVFALLQQFDAMKSKLYQIEQDLTRECLAYGRTKGYAFLYPEHVRRIARLQKEQSK